MSVSLTSVALGIGGAVVGVMIVTKILKSALGSNQPPAEDSDGHEVWRGSGKEARQVIHQLADAGVIAWSEALDAEQVAVYVDHDQHEQVPALMKVQQQIAEHGQEAVLKDASPQSQGGTP